MDKNQKEKVKEAIDGLEEAKKKEPTVEDLKAQVEQLRMENQQLKMRVQALAQANQKGQQLLQYMIERFYDDEVAREHDHAMRQVAEMRMQGGPKDE